MDIVEFLRARLDEDEASAKVAVSLSHGDDPDWYERYEWAWHSEYRNGGAGSMFLPGAPSPARVLRDISAKRRIVDSADAAPYGSGDAENVEAGWSDHSDLVLRLLAVVYDDHPDYRQEWKP